MPPAWSPTRCPETARCSPKRPRPFPDAFNLANTVALGIALAAAAAVLAFARGRTGGSAAEVVVEDAELDLVVAATGEVRE